MTSERGSESAARKDSEEATMVVDLNKWGVRCLLDNDNKGLFLKYLGRRRREALLQGESCRADVLSGMQQALSSMEVKRPFDRRRDTPVVKLVVSGGEKTRKQNFRPKRKFSKYYSTKQYSTNVAFAY